MSARVLVVGLDATEVDLVDRLVAEGRLPTFAMLADSASQRPLSTPLDTLPGAIWPELSTGRHGWRTGLYFHPHQLHSGEARPRPIREQDAHPEDQYWVRAARHGRRVLSVDMPQSAVVTDLPSAVQICEWAVHDRQWGTRSEPPAALEEIIARWGEPPVDLCDDHGQTAAGLRGLRDDLLSQVGVKQEWLVELLGRESWDLATVTFGDLHCAGHQLLHLWDPANPWHEPGTPPDLRSALPDVYAAIDRALGEVIRAAGPEATVLVVASHGMDTYIGGYQLLRGVLEKLWPASPVSRALAAPSRLPASVRALARAVVPAGLRRRRIELSRQVDHPLELPGTRAVSVSNNRVGAIRLNLVGREPHGVVAPGPDADRTLAEITEALLELRQPSSGEAIVTRVTRSEVFGPERHPDLPDLLVEFRRDLGPLDACESPRLGRVEAPVRHADLPRSGDHTDHARWWVRGPGIRPVRHAEPTGVIDLAPTVLRLLDVPVPADMDGRALDLTDAG